MEKRRPIQADLHAGGQPRDGGEIVTERFREAMARWAATVTIFAVRDPDDGAVHATTVTSFASISVDPPAVVISLSPSAQALPFVEVGGEAGLSLLAEGQTKLASTFADSYPVGAPPWPGEGAPVVADAAAALALTVEAVHPAPGDSRLVVCRVRGLELGAEERPLVYWKRSYRRLEER